MEAVAAYPQGSRRTADVPPISVVQPYSDDEGNTHNMVRRTEPDVDDAMMREAMHGMMLAQTSFCKALEAQAGQAKPNGNRTTIIAALVLGMLPWAFNAVWWTRGTERDLARTVDNHTDTLKELRDKVAIMDTWEEKLRNNMSAYGWLIDREGNVSRIDEGVKPKRR